MTKYSAISTDDTLSQASGSDLLGIDQYRTSDQTPLLRDSVEAEDEYQDNSHGSAGYFSCTINLANTILGTGMLAMPAAVASVGYLLGSIMILYAALASGLGLYFLSRAAARVKRRNASFFAVSQLTYPKAALFFDLAIVIKCFGVGISYLIIIGDLMPKVVSTIGDSFVDSSSLLTDRRLWITLFMIVITPLTFMRKLDSLRHTSFIALIAVVYMVFIVIYYYIGPDFEYPPKDKVHLINFSGKFFANIPIFVFAFTCHQNIFSVYNELVDNKQNKINRVIVSSIGVTAIVYQIIGIIGYLSFGDDVLPNVFSMYQSSVIVTIGRMAIVILVLFSYPLQAHPARASLDKILLSFNSFHSSPETNHIVLTTVILVGSYITAMLVSKLDLVLAFVGSTGSTSISFILPGIFYYKLHENAPWDIKKVLSVYLIIYGFLVMCICLTVNILRVLYMH